MYIVPEDARQEAPPSYASAQADAVPPYWETTVHAPFAPDSIGEMVVGSLPTGSLFSFCWNLLVSISFQFVGFLLTYLLHTSHAARLGSRAGLGVTLIQYGFALRGRVSSSDGVLDKSDWNDWGTDTPPRHGHHHASNRTWGSPIGNMTEQQTNSVVDATTEWLSFLLMTIGTSTKICCLFCESTNNTALKIRLVRAADLFTWILARKTLGTWSSCGTTRFQCSDPEEP